MSKINFREYTNKTTPLTISEIVSMLPATNKRIYLAVTNSVMWFTWVSDSANYPIYQDRRNHAVTWYFCMSDQYVKDNIQLPQRYALEVSFDPKNIWHGTKTRSWVYDLTTDNLKFALEGGNQWEIDVKYDMYFKNRQALWLYLEGIINGVCVDVVHKDDAIILFFD